MVVLAGVAVSYERGASLALSQSIWAKQFVGPGLFPARKVTDLYRKPSMLTCEQSVKPSEAELGLMARLKTIKRFLLYHSEAWIHVWTCM